MPCTTDNDTAIVTYNNEAVTEKPNQDIYRLKQRVNRWLGSEDFFSRLNHVIEHVNNWLCHDVSLDFNHEVASGDVRFVSLKCFVCFN